jgi:hypothetical protein
MSYQQKYIKYKTKYTALKSSITTNQIQKKFQGGNPPVNYQERLYNSNLYTNPTDMKSFTLFDKLYTQPKSNSSSTKFIFEDKDKLCTQPVSNSSSIKYNFEEKENKIIYDYLSKIKNKDYDINKVNQVVIEYTFLKYIYKITIGSDNIITFYIKIPLNYLISIHNNVLNIPGISILLDNIEDVDNTYISKTNNIFEMYKDGKIMAKHIKESPYSDFVNGVLISEIANELKIKDVDYNNKKICIDIKLEEDYVLINDSDLTTTSNNYYENNLLL